MILSQALILGLLQGITEWLPISSEGQSVLLGVGWMGMSPAEALSYAIFLHLGTTAAVLIRFRQDYISMIRDLRSNETKILIIATFCTGITGVPLYFLFKDSFSGGAEVMLLVGLLLMATGVLLAVGHRKNDVQKGLGENRTERTGETEAIRQSESGTALTKAEKKSESETDCNIREEEVVQGESLSPPAAPNNKIQIEKAGQNNRKDITEITLLDMVLLGLIQGLAILPGVSRSGVTTTTLLLRNVRQDTALRLSFIISVPPVLGAVILDASYGVVPIHYGIVMFLSALVVGYLMMDLLIRFARQVSFALFCVALGLLTIVVSLVLL